MEVQLLMAAISPWSVGLPMSGSWLNPVQMSVPRGASGGWGEVWLTMAVPKAAKVHGDGRAALAMRIQCRRVDIGISMSGSMGGSGSLVSEVCPDEQAVAYPKSREASNARMNSIGAE